MIYIIIVRLYKQSLMQLVTSNRLLSQDNLLSNIDIKNQIESMHALQTNLLNIFQQSEKQLQRKHSKLKEVTKMSSTQAGKIKQLLDSFAYQCKNEWVMIWQQFFSLFQRIVDLYQLKIGKLQEKIVQKDACIQNLRLQQKPSESNSKQAQFALFDYKQHRQIQNSITKEEESGLFSEKMQKRVKISDVIAEYNQGKSVSSNMANSFAEAVTEENDQSESDQAGAPKVLMEIADQLNRQTLSYKFSRFSDRHHAQRLGDNYCEMSAILSGQSSHRISPVKQSKAKKHSLRTSKENSLFYSKKAKESEDIKKRNSYLSKNLKSYESQVLNPGGKLDELRKNLLQRKKSEHIL